MPTPESLWQEISRGNTSKRLVADFLRAGSARWEPGTWIFELARVLGVEHELENSSGMRGKPEPLVLAKLTEVPQTQRIDGIISLKIPKPLDVSILVESLCDQVLRLKLGSFPEADSRVRCELEICLLALLHRRNLLTDHHLRLELYVSCPQGSNGKFAKTLHLAADLPLGGRITIFHTGLHAEESCAFPPQGACYAKCLRTIRDDAQMLRFDRD